MTRIVEWAVNNTRVVIALIVVVIVAGLIAFIKIPKEAQPDIPIPVLMVQVTYPGISPEDSERLLVKPLETALRSVEGIKTMTARAYSGVVGVRVVANGIVHFVPVKILSDSPEGMWVAGVPSGTAVITVGQEFVTDGERVKAVFDKTGTPS